MKIAIRTLSLGLICWLGTHTPAALSQVTDSNKYTPPNYSTFQPPVVGDTYTDPVFGTAVQRLTSAPTTPNLDSGGNLIFITDEYSSMSPFNLDNSKILVIYQSYFALYDGSGSYLKALPFEINSGSEPRWSRSNPNLLYYHSGNQLKQYDASTDASSVVHTFSEYSTISGKGESDISFDGDHFVFAGDNRYVFVYELSTNSKGAAFDTAGHGFDSVYITPNNNVTITWLQAGASRYTGIEFFDRNMVFKHQVAHAGGHMDVTRDSNGDEVLVWTNSGDMSPIAGCNNGIVKIHLSDGQQTCLLSLDWNLAVHISGPDNTGWVFVETYAPSNPDPGSSGWVPYTNEILQIKLDGTQTRRLLHHRSRPFDSYNYTPRVSVSRDGSRFIYNSNYDLQAILSYPTDYSDVYLAVLSGSITPPPPAPPSSAPSITTSEVPSGAQNTAYSATLAGSGGSTPYNWSLTSGSLPAGLTLASSTGAITGTPTATGTSTFTVQLMDASLQTSAKAFSVAVSAAVSAPAPPPSSTATTRSEQNGPAVTYSGTWFPNALPGHSGGSATLSTDAGSRATFTFTGTAVRWLGYRDEWSGIANVYLDGELKTTVDTYASPSQYQAVLFSATGLSANSHTLVIEAAGTHGSASAGSWVWVDAFDVDNTTSGGGNPTTSTNFEQNDASVSYNGNWSSKNLTLFSGGSAVMAMDNRATAALSFQGTGASWIGYRDAWSGIAAVYLDGVLVGKVDTYSPTDIAQPVLYSITGLSPGSHTLKVQSTGKKNRASGGAWIWVDAFNVKP